MQSLSELLGHRIKEVRTARNIKQVELATMIDIEPTNLSKIEKGVHLPKDDTINKITKALNIDIRELFNFSHIQTKKELLKGIDKHLAEAKLEDLEFFYKILVAYRETQKK